MPLSFAIIDIDNFKTNNDTYGHLEGDKVLVELAGILKTQARSGDTIVRWGDEEFAMILPETDKNSIKQIKNGTFLGEFQYTF